MAGYEDLDLGDMYAAVSGWEADYKVDQYEG